MEKIRKQQGEAPPKEKPQKSIAEKKNSSSSDTETIGNNVPKKLGQLPVMEQLKIHQEAIAYILYHFDDMKEAIRDHTKILNQINQKLAENET